MAKGKRKHKGGGHGQPVPAKSPEAILDELSATLDEIAEVGVDAAGPRWGQVHKLLLKTDLSAADTGRLIATRDLAGLRAQVAALRGEPVTEEPEPAEPAPAGPEVDADTRRKAMRAFRKRLKLTRLDHESKLGVGPMTGGKKADVDAIMAPREFGPEVWEALVAEGQLKHMGRSFYMLAEEAC